MLSEIIGDHSCDFDVIEGEWLGIPQFVKGKAILCKSPWRNIWLWDVEAATFSGQSAHIWLWSCQPYAPAALYPHEDSWYSFLLEAEPIPGP
jgi:hypothetical protein